MVFRMSRTAIQTMTNYVAGLMFSIDREWVAVIRKERPQWQAGKLNAIGGKIEDGESSLEAMVREFHEETGVYNHHWERIAGLKHRDAMIWFFAAFSESVFNVETKTDEAVELLRVADLKLYGGTVKNLPFILALALDQSGIQKPLMLTDVSL